MPSPASTVYKRRHRSCYRNQFQVPRGTRPKSSCRPRNHLLPESVYHCKTFPSTLLVPHKFCTFFIPLFNLSPRLFRVRPVINVRPVVTFPTTNLHAPSDVVHSLANWTVHISHGYSIVTVCSKCAASPPLRNFTVQPSFAVYVNPWFVPNIGSIAMRMPFSSFTGPADPAISFGTCGSM